MNKVSRLWGTFFAIALVLVSAFGGASPASAADTSDWTLDNLNGTIGDWTAGFEPGPGTPPAGSGSFYMAFTTSAAELSFRALRYPDTKFVDFDTLSYSTYTNQAGRAMTFQVVYDPDITDGNTLSFGRLIYQPSLNGSVTAGGWQTWDMLDSGNGLWYASSNANSPVDDVCTLASPCTWTTLTTTWPNIGTRKSAGSYYIMFQAGSGWKDFRGNVDNLNVQINGVLDTYDFETGSLGVSGTSVDCPPSNTVTYGSDITCVATVESGDGVITPTGTVNWTTASGGTFPLGTSCVLAGAGGTATCSVSYRPGGVGALPATVAASYAGDTNMSGSAGDQSITVNPLGLTVTATGVNKTYDGTTDTTVTLSSNAVMGDDITLTYTAAAFDTKNAGTGKTVNVTGISISGTDADNYTLLNDTASATADITAKDLTVTATGVNKTYDGTTDATVTLSSDALPGDDVVPGYTSAAFDDKNVGAGKNVSVTGISLGGADGGNYNLLNDTASTTADITARDLIVSATGVDKVYDGTTDATVTLSSDAVLGDDIVPAYTGAAFDDENVGAGKNVSITGISVSGTDAGNYNAPNTTAGTTADITPKGLTITGLSAVDKIYDGLLDAGLGGTAALVGVIDPDVVDLGGTPTAAFDTKDVGSSKPVSVSGYTLSGTDAGNYALSQPTGLTANITPKGLTITGVSAVDKVYDGLTAATLSGTPALDGVIAPDVVDLGGTPIASFASKDVGSSKPVSVSGYTISGADAGNYLLSQPSGLTASITKASLTVTADDKTKVVGDPDPDFTFTYGAFQGTDTAADIDTAPTCAAAEPHTDPGSYPIVCSGGADDNYDFSFVNGTLVVTGSLNTPPTDISLSATSLSENHAIGYTIGTLSNNDPDPDTFTYSKCGGADDAAFTIDGNALKTAAKFNFEAKSSYPDLCIQVDDGQGGSTTKTFAITVTDLPETFYSAATLDGWILESTETSGKGGTLNNTLGMFYLGDNAANKQFRAIMSFNTAGLPDNAVITSAFLKIRQAGVTGTNPFTTHGSILVDIRKGSFSASQILQLQDFQALANKNAALAILNTPVSGWYTKSLGSGNFTYLNKAGVTQFRLRFRLDDNNDLGADFLKFYSGNAALASKPVLVIQYTIP